MIGPDGDPLASDDMDETACLFVLSLHMDGRAVEPELLAAARHWADAHPQAQAALADFEEQRAALAEAPTRRAGEGFTARVLTAMGFGAEAPEPLLPYVRRLAVAAGLTLAVSLGWGIALPARLAADDDIDRMRHAVDHFRATPFEADDIVEGLRARLADPLFGTRSATEELR